MDSANPTVLLLPPTALETKSTFLGKACKVLHGLALPPSSCLPTPTSWLSFSRPEVCTGWAWNAAPHPLPPAFHSRLRTRVTGVP